jgi:aryl-alcohol dehydrogenase-like predicted oxidoreductase
MHGVYTQVQYSLIYRAPELDTGVLEACNEAGVTLVAYSPMAQGLLTGALNNATSPMLPSFLLCNKLPSDALQLDQSRARVFSSRLDSKSVIAFYRVLPSNRFV